MRVHIWINPPFGFINGFHLDIELPLLWGLRHENEEIIRGGEDLCGVDAIFSDGCEAIACHVARSFLNVCPTSTCFCCLEKDEAYCTRTCLSWFDCLNRKQARLLFTCGLRSPYTTDQQWDAFKNLPACQAESSSWHLNGNGSTLCCSVVQCWEIHSCPRHCSRKKTDFCSECVGKRKLAGTMEEEQRLLIMAFVFHI